MIILGEIEMKYTAQQIKEWYVAKAPAWTPARPENRLSLLGRIKLAWGVVTGRYDVLDWE